jgi:3',5'-cyclic AMP phosphodiesterase CpdA
VPSSVSSLALVVAHVTDTHFGHDAGQAADRTRRVVDALLHMNPRPDVLVHSGDVTDHGYEKEYAEAVQVLSAWEGPLVISPGNHDVRAPYVDAFLDGPLASPDGRANRAHTVDGVRFLMLDSLIDEVDGERQDPGYLGPDTLAWLDGELAADLAPTFVVLHHPPVELGISLMDPIKLTDSADLCRVLERHPHVRATLCGHAHTMGASTFAGRPLLVGGGAVSTVPLDQEDLPIVWYDAPPSYGLHFLHADGRVTTHWRALSS